MGEVVGKGKIVTNGLVLSLNAADRNSYPGSGTTWRDVATNRTATITGTNSFNSGNGGYLTGFVDNSSRINVNSPDTSTIGSCTIQAFFAYEGSQPSDGSILSYDGASGGVYMTNGSFGGSGRRLVFYSDFGGRLATWPNEIADGAWTFVSGVRNTANFSMSISVNGATRVTNTYGSLPSFTPTDAWMISRLKTGGVTFKGRYAILLYYNRALSVAEEIQNYNATKSRFRL